MHEVTRILSAIEQGDPQAAEQLLPLVYDELRCLATQRLAAEKPGLVPEATSLVHEAYLRLVDVEQVAHWNSRGHFFAAAGEAMRRILIDRARRRRRPKHGGALNRAELEVSCVGAEDRDEELEAVSDALLGLEADSPEKAALVKLRYFAGMSLGEAADALGISRATANRYWSYAKAFLYCAIRDKEFSRKSAGP